MNVERRNRIAQGAILTVNSVYGSTAKVLQGDADFRADFGPISGSASTRFASSSDRSHDSVHVEYIARAELVRTQPSGTVSLSAESEAFASSYPAPNFLQLHGDSYIESTVHGFEIRVIAQLQFKREALRESFAAAAAVDALFVKGKGQVGLSRVIRSRIANVTFEVSGRGVQLSKSQSTSVVNFFHKQQAEAFFSSFLAGLVAPHKDSCASERLEKGLVPLRADIVSLDQVPETYRHTEVLGLVVQQREIAEKKRELGDDVVSAQRRLDALEFHRSDDALVPVAQARAVDARAEELSDVLKALKRQSRDCEPAVPPPADKAESQTGDCEPAVPPPADEVERFLPPELDFRLSTRGQWAYRQSDVTPGSWAGMNVGYHHAATGVTGPVLQLSTIGVLWVEPRGGADVRLQFSIRAPNGHWQDGATHPATEYQHLGGRARISGIRFRLAGADAKNFRIKLTAHFHMDGDVSGQDDHSGWTTAEPTSQEHWLGGFHLRIVRLATQEAP